MRHQTASGRPMDKILACPHCGPNLNGARLRCSRCGRELIYIGQDELVGLPGEAAAPDPPTAIARPRGVWAGVTAAAVAVLALAGIIRPWDWLGGPVAGGQARMAVGAPLAGGDRGPGAGVDPSVGPDEALPADASAAVVRPNDLEQLLERHLAALDAQPSDPVLLDRVGQILVTLNRPAEAVPFLEQAVEAEPWSVVARFDLAGACARSGQPDKAVEHYGVLVQAGTTDARVYHNQALALRQLGRNAEAASAFQRATALAPDEAPAWLGLAISLEATGQRAEAAAALERYLELQPSGQEADNARANLARLRAEPAAAQPGTEPAAGAPRQRP